MRTFHSYGPVNSKKHYSVPRTQLVSNCVRSLIGDLDDFGQYFTIWGARQTGKTWLFRQSMEIIKQQYGDQFCIGEISMQDIVFNTNDDPTNIFLMIFPP